MARLPQRSGYCRVANLKVQRDYYKAMQVVLQRTQTQLGEDDEEEGSMEKKQNMLRIALTNVYAGVILEDKDYDLKVSTNVQGQGSHACNVSKRPVGP